MPLGAFIVSERIMDALQHVPADARFMHAYTNSAHPTAAAVGLRNLRIFEEEHLVENAQVMGDRLGDGLRGAIGTHAHVANVRNLGHNITAGDLHDRGRIDGLAPQFDRCRHCRFWSRVWR